MKTILFSIIIPIYNVEQYLCQCVDSVLSQTYVNYEIIMVDDGSFDKCPLICDEYVRRDERCRVIHKTNGGLSSARNAGLDVAIGDYILFLDSDDYWAEDVTLERIQQKLSLGHFDVLVFGMYKYFQVDKRMIKVSKRYDCFSSPLSSLMNNNIYVASACDKVYSRLFINENVIRFKDGQRSEDIEWCIKILRVRPCIDCINGYYYVYRQQNPNSITSTVSVKHLEDIFAVILKYARKEPISREEIEINHFLAKYYLMLLYDTIPVSTRHISMLLSQMTNYYYLLNYDWYPHVRRIKYVKWIGMYNLRRLLRVYRLIKKTK